MQVTERLLRGSLLLTGLLLIGAFVIVSAFIGLVLLGRATPQFANAISTLVLVLVTIIYAYLTQLLVRETRTARRQEVAPALELEGHVSGLRLANIGNGPAKNLSGTLQLAGDTEEATEFSRQSLNSGEYIWFDETPFSAVTDPEAAVQDDVDTVIISAEYTDLLGEPTTSTVSRDVEQLQSQQPAEKLALERIDDTLRRIETQLERLNK